MFEEIFFNETQKIIRFYVDYLPFEILTEIENDPIPIITKRKLELELDFEKYGDYLHSNLYTEDIKEENIEE